MPSPLAHALAGLIVHVATAPAGELASRRRAAVTVGAALAPDLDFAWKLLDDIVEAEKSDFKIFERRL